MNSQELQEKLKKSLEKLNCTNVDFPDPKDDLVVVTFKSDNPIDLNETFDGWTRSGIQGGSVLPFYRFDFTKIK